LAKTHNLNSNCLPLVEEEKKERRRESETENDRKIKPSRS
jgi:hypothetical protein